MRVWTIDETTGSYDGFGRVSKVTDPRGHFTEYAYDRLHRLTKVIEPHPSGSYSAGVETGRPETEYVYDKAGQLLRKKEKLVDPISPEEQVDRVTSYLWDGLGRLVRTVEPNPTGGGVPEEYGVLIFAD